MDKKLAHPGADKNIAARNDWISAKIKNLPLTNAVKNNDIKAVQTLLNFKVNVNEEGYYGTPLHVASERGFKDIVELLIRAGADLNAEQFSYTPLYRAAVRGHVEIVKMLINAGATVKDDGKSLTILHDLIWFHEENEKIVDLLLKAGADVVMNKKDDVYIPGNTPLYEAVRYEKEKTVKVLLDYGANTEVKNFSGETALHKAANDCSLAMMKLLLDSGADVNAKDYSGLTPLLCAIRSSDFKYNKKEAVKFLLNADAEVDAEGCDFKSALYLAVEKGYEKIVELLIEAKAYVDCFDPVTGNTPLHVAVLYKRKKILKMLIDAGANFSAQNDEAMTPWMNTFPQCTSELSKILIDAGANVNKKSYYCNETLLHGAAEKNNYQIIETLLSQGFDINAKTNSGLTPLHCALQENKGSSHFNTIKILLEKGANPLALDKEDKLPIHFLSTNGDKQINSAVIELLSRHMSKALCNHNPKKVPGKKADPKKRSTDDFLRQQKETKKAKTKNNVFQ